MRTTIRIEDDLLTQLREQAHKERLSLTQLLDRTLRAGMRAASAGRPRRSLYREETRTLGAPRVGMEKALALAASLEDEEAVRKLALRGFYPDFVGLLVDGRVLVVEYKGKDRFDMADSEEKRAVGAVWAARSGGRCLFAMPTNRDFSSLQTAVQRA